MIATAVASEPVKLSVSIPAGDVEFIDRYLADHDVGSRSAVVQRALNLLRAVDLEDAYAAAWEEWEKGDGPLWDATVADGLDP